VYGGGVGGGWGVGGWGGGGGGGGGAIPQTEGKQRKQELLSVQTILTRQKHTWRVTDGPAKKMKKLQ